MPATMCDRIMHSRGHGPLLRETDAVPAAAILHSAPKAVTVSSDWENRG
jgi:hypothetical protein